MVQPEEAQKLLPWQEEQLATEHSTHWELAVRKVNPLMQSEQTSATEQAEQLRLLQLMQVPLTWW